MIDYYSNHRETELNHALEAMYFGFRAMIAEPDAILADMGMARVHHRILYFIGRNPRCSIKELLQRMGVSKQYIHQPLRRLIEEGHVSVETDARDRRVRRLTLTDKGMELETRLSGTQRARFARVFERAGPEAEAGWRVVMRLLAESGNGN